MEWRILMSAFVAIFLAEMGDKTQLAAMIMAADTKRPWAVFLGASLALTCVSALGVFVGASLSATLPMGLIKRVAGGAFVVIGVLMLADKL